MATIITKGDMLHIQWYDSVSKKTQSKSTKLKNTPSNKKKAEFYAKKLQQELTKKNTEMKQLGIKSITIKESFEHFLNNNQDKHKNTIYEYNRFYKKFTEYFDENSSCSSITKIEVEAWINQIKKLNYKQNTIHTYGKQCTHFLNFLFEYQYLQMFKINRSVKTKPQKVEKVTLQEAHIKSIFENLDTKNSNFRTTIYLAFYTGLRSSDLINITVEGIELVNTVLRYYSPKRKIFREIAFHKDLVPVLSERIAEIKSGPIIEYKNIHSMGRAVERYFVKLNLRKQAETESLNSSANKRKEYSMRTFRKTFITLCRSVYNMDSTIVRELVGHEHENTTDRYYNQVSISAMKTELEKFKRPQ